MRTFYLLALVASVTLIACDFSKSTEINLTTGLSTKGDGLSSSDVYLTVGNDKKTTRTTFIYGETFFVNFRNVSGFKKEADVAYPGMEIAVIGEKGDTALYYEDLYADRVDGVIVSPMFLYTNITVAKPMNSGKKYKLHVKIWDKKGKGTFKAKMDFDIVPNEHIVVEKSEKLAYNDIYLFSREEKSITDNQIKFNQTYYMIFEGLDGFATENGKMNVGLRMKATTADGEVLLNEADLLGDGEYDPALVNEQISANFIFKDATIKTPVDCEFVVFDKKSDATVSAKISLEVY